MRVVGNSLDLFNASQRILKLKPDVVLLGTLPTSENDRTLFGQLKRALPDVRYVLHTSLRQEAVTADLIEGDVSVCLVKGSSPRKIVQTVREACHGHLNTMGVVYPAAG